ncbi:MULTISPECIES: hypothetical protein [Acidiphilium]|nr:MULTISPECIES: hypothetical protein [Acidiphilium]HQT84868.1 hypothetical protein [Acidiphilium rubrum]
MPPIIAANTPSRPGTSRDSHRRHSVVAIDLASNSTSATATNARAST